MTKPVGVVEKAFRGIYIYGHAPPQNQPFNKNTGLSHIKCSFSVYFFWKHFLIKHFRRKKGNTTNVKNKTIESKNKKQKSSFGFWFLRKPKIFVFLTVMNISGRHQ